MHTKTKRNMHRHAHTHTHTHTHTCKHRNIKIFKHNKRKTNAI